MLFCSNIVVVKYLTNVNINVDGIVGPTRLISSISPVFLASDAYEVRKTKEYEFKVVKETTTKEEESEKFVIILKATNRLTACEIELKVKTENALMAQDELGFGLDMGDTVKFTRGKIGKQIKIAPTDEDTKKITPDKIQPDKPDMTITAEDREKVKRDRQKRKRGRPEKVKD